LSTALDTTSETPAPLPAAPESAVDDFFRAIRPLRDVAGQMAPRVAENL
jgi:hypothetical protein